MGVAAKLFIRDGVLAKDIKFYLEKTYGNVYSNLDEIVYGNDKFPTIAGRICFGRSDKDLSRPKYAIFLYISGSDIDEDYPVSHIPGTSISISASLTNEYIEILRNMAKTFGGFVCENDCKDLDAPDYWKFFEASSDSQFKKKEKVVEDKIYKLIQSFKERKGQKVSKNSPKADYVVDFILENLEEIKKL